MLLFDVLTGSKTLSLATLLITILGKAYKDNHVNEWVYNQLPEKYKEKATLEEFEDAFEKGKAFIASVWKLLH